MAHRIEKLSVNLWIRILAYLNNHEGVSSTKLKKALNVNMDCITSNTVYLEEQEILKRNLKGRKNRITLTEKGKRVAEASQQLMYLLPDSDKPRYFF